jgi:flagellar biosynthetic protein FliR
MNALAFNFMLAFLRVSGLLAVFPLFSTRSMPIQVRTALGAFSAILVAPFMKPLPTTDHSIMWLIGIMFQELFVGLILGFSSRMVFFALDFAGGLISTEMGLSFSPNLDPFTNTQTQAPGLLLYFLGIMILLSLNMHHQMLLSFQQSYVLLPPGELRLEEALLLALIKQTSGLFYLGLQLAAPMIATSFIVTVSMAVLGRAAPQINVFAESFGVRVLLGLIVFGLTMHLMAFQIANALRRMPADLAQLCGLLGI